MKLSQEIFHDLNVGYVQFYAKLEYVKGPLVAKEFNDWKPSLDLLKFPAKVSYKSNYSSWSNVEYYEKIRFWPLEGLRPSPHLITIP